MNKARLLCRFIYEVSDASHRKPKLSFDSVDDQIDSILLKFESDCIVGIDEDQSQELGESYLYEADDDESGLGASPPPAKKLELGNPDDEKKDEIKSQVADAEDEIPDAESDPLKPKIDLKKFCGKVSRLSVNFDALLNLSIAIVNRARNYIEQNYGKALADEFAEIMERDYNIELEYEDSSEPRQSALAVGAAASGLGG